MRPRVHALHAIAHADLMSRLSRKMLWISVGWRLECAGLFSFRHDLPRHARGSRYAPGAAAAGPDPWDSPKNNPVSTTRRIATWEQTLNDAWETGRAGVHASEEAESRIKAHGIGLFPESGPTQGTTFGPFRWAL